MEVKEKIKILGQQHAFGIRKLIEVGDSYGLTLPKAWVIMHCTKINGHYYFSLDVEGNSIFCNPIDLEDIESIEFKEKTR